MTPSVTPPANKSRFSWLIATFFGVGYLRPGPGTYASFATVLIWWCSSRYLPSPWLLPVAVFAAVLVSLIGIPPSTVVARESGIKDPGFVVIDEVAGQMIALIAVPLNWKYLLASLILFRVFDIMKPFPLRRLEKLPEGTGIMMDDVGAGLYALVLLQIWSHWFAR
ncbi:MAG TPA: phosphatidylglycerophosphatase A [Verrucomicrobiae bacterium]|jgi:phosphatidylglycerophosphatase A|nr:phosphatidylglycerophosphatase A [Verrucomicrobiae bacterium]